MNSLYGRNPHVTTRCYDCNKPSVTAFCDACAPPDPSQFRTNNARALSQKTQANRPATIHAAFGNNMGHGTRRYKEPKE